MKITSMRPHPRLTTQHLNHFTASIASALTLCLALHSAGLAQPSMPPQSAPAQSVRPQAPQRQGVPKVQQVQQTPQMQRVQQGPQGPASRQSFGAQSSALQGESLEELILSKCNLGDAFTAEIARAIAYSGRKKLKSLVLSHNNIDMRGGESLGELLAHDGSIENCLNIVHCGNTF